MSADYLKELTLIEHSYVKTPTSIKFRFEKLPTQTIFRRYPRGYQYYSSKRYYQLGLSEMIALREFYTKTNLPIFNEYSLNEINTSLIDTDLLRKIIKILKEYSGCIQRLYHGQITESNLRTHRIMAEYFGPKFLRVINETKISADSLATLINTILQHLEETYLLFLIELIIFCKNQMTLSLALFSTRNGNFIPDVSRCFWGNRFTIENLTKLVEIMWTPTIHEPFSTHVSGNHLVVFFVPPIPFGFTQCSDSGMEEDIKGGVDTFMYSERLHNFCRNFSKLGRIIFYRTEYIPSQHSSDINSLQHWIDYISYNLNTKINNMRSRHPSTSVIVVGWSVSASIAYKLYLFNPKNIQCLILINFPTQTNTNEIKKFTQSQINNTHCPILFVTGSESSISKTEDIERLRNSLQCPTGFIRAKHCDDVLNLPPKYKLMMNIPQDIVDMKITEKISNFIRHHYCGDRIESTNAELSQNEDSDSDDTIFSTILLENGR